jgi:hypothetical protein
MKCYIISSLLAGAFAAKDTTPPVISLNLDEMTSVSYANRHSDTGSIASGLDTGCAGDGCASDHSEYDSNSANAWARRAEVQTTDNDALTEFGTNGSPQPSVHDHHDKDTLNGDIVVKANLFVRSDAKSAPVRSTEDAKLCKVTTADESSCDGTTTYTGQCTGNLCRLAPEEYKQRGEFVLQYDVEDNAGNAAETLVFAMIMRDTAAPSVITAISDSTIEAGLAPSSGSVNANEVYATGSNLVDRLTVHGFQQFSVQDAYDGVLVPDGVTESASDHFQLNDADATAVDLAAEQLNVAAVGSHAFVFAAKDYANIFGDDNQDNAIDSATYTCTITVDDRTAPRLYLKPLAVASNAETASCGGTASATITSLAACREHNMRTVLPSPWNINDSCHGCSGTSCYTMAGTTNCETVHRGGEEETTFTDTVECASAFDTDDAAVIDVTNGASLASGAWCVDDSDSARSVDNGSVNAGENDESLLGSASITAVADGDLLDIDADGKIMTVATYSQSFTCDDSAGLTSDQVTRTISVVDTTQPVLKITHLGRGFEGNKAEEKAAQRNDDNGATHATGFEASTGAPDWDGTYDAWTDLQTVFHSAGYVADKDMIDNLLVAGTGWSCVDDCEGILTSTPLVDGEKGSKAVWYSGSPDSDFSTCTGTELTGGFSFLEKGDYCIQYTCSDGHTADVTMARKVKNVDHTKPIIQILEADQQTYEATKSDNYVDAGATCKDEVDGNISQDVEVSGDVVNLARVGTYRIYYNCQDSVGNTADPATRTVIVQDNTCPTCTFEDGEQTINIEASFKYTDQPASDITCTEPNLDETITPTVTMKRTLDADGAAAPADLIANVAGDDFKIPNVAGDAAYFWNHVGTYEIHYLATDSVGNNNLGEDVDGTAGGCTFDSTLDATQNVRTVVVVDTLRPVIQLSLTTGDESQVVKTGSAQSPFDKDDFDATRTADQARFNAQKDTHSDGHSSYNTPSVTTWSTPTLMAEESTTSSVNGWVMGAIASAVSGLALLGYSLRKQATPVATSVPV